MFHIAVVDPNQLSFQALNEVLAVESLADFKCWCEPGETWNADDDRIVCLKWKISIKGVIFFETPWQPLVRLVTIPEIA